MLITPLINKKNKNEPEYQQKNKPLKTPMYAKQQRINPSSKIKKSICG